LTNDVNFALTNLNNERYFGHERFANGKRLVLSQIPGGDYEFIIYAHQPLTNLKTSPIESIEIAFELDFHFIHWSEVDDFKQHYLMMDLGSKKGQEDEVKVPLEALELSELKCH